MTEDRRVVQMNYSEGTNVAPKGARAYLVLLNPGGGEDRIVILVRSRSGRWVRKYESAKRLTNPRAVTIPPEHRLYGDERLWDYDAEETAARLRTAWEADA